MCRTQEIGFGLGSGFARGRLTVLCVLQVTDWFQLKTRFLQHSLSFELELIPLCEVEFSFVFSLVRVVQKFASE
jgi:hypothetical protein